MATLFLTTAVCSLLGFVPLEAFEGLSTQRVWHGASQRGDRVKSVRGSRTIHYKINDDVCVFHPVLYATLVKRCHDDLRNKITEAVLKTAQKLVETLHKLRTIVIT